MARTYRSTPQPYFSAKSEVAEKNGSGKEIKEVIANPTLTGEEPDLEGLQVGKEKYKAPEGEAKVVVSDMTALTSVQCEQLKVGDKVILIDTNSESLYLVSYKDESNLYLDSYAVDNYSAYVVAVRVIYEKSDNVWSCSDWFDTTLNEVRANPTIPSGTTPTPLQNLQVGNNFYSAPEGGGAKVVVITNSTANVETDIVLTSEQQEDLFEVVQGNTFAKDAVINYVWNYGAVGGSNYLNIELTLTDKYTKIWTSNVMKELSNILPEKAGECYYEAKYFLDNSVVYLTISKTYIEDTKALKEEDITAGKGIKINKYKDASTWTA